MVVLAVEAKEVADFQVLMENLEPLTLVVAAEALAPSEY
jgi:hypothetical protein